MAPWQPGGLVHEAVLQDGRLPGCSSGSIQSREGQHPRLNGGLEKRRRPNQRDGEGGQVRRGAYRSLEYPRESVTIHRAVDNKNFDGA